MLLSFFLLMINESFKQKVKSISTTILFLLLMASASFCIASSADGEAVSSSVKSPRVVFINPGFSDRGFWSDVSATMQAAANQLGLELTVYYADRQWPKMIQLAEQVIDQETKPDFLILVNEHKQAASLLVKANKAGIPSLMLLNDLTDEQRNRLGNPRNKLTNWIGSLTPDNERAGYEMALSLMATPRAQKNHGSIALLTLVGDNQTPASMERLKGLDTALLEHSMLQEMRRITVNWSRQEAYQRTKLWLQTENDLNAVWAANDDIGLGAIQAIIEAGKAPGQDVLVTGLNWSEEAVHSVLNGEMTLTHGGHFMAGAWSMVLLYDYIKGKDFGVQSARLQFPMTAITPENGQTYLDLLANGHWHDVDFRRFSLVDDPSQQDYQFTLNKLLDSVQK